MATTDSQLGTSGTPLDGGGKTGAAARTVNAGDVRTVYQGTVRILDIVSVLLVGIFAYWLRHGHFGLPQIYIVAMALAALLTTNYMHLFGGYKLDRFGDVAMQVSKMAQAWAAVVITIILIAFFTKTSTSFSRIWVGSWMSLSFLAMFGARAVLYSLMRRWQAQGLLKTNLIVVGTRTRCDELMQALSAGGANQLDIRRQFVLSEDPTSNKNAAVLSELEDYVTSNPVDDAIVALPLANDSLHEIVRCLKASDCDVALNPPAIGYELPNLGAYDVNGATMVRVMARPISGWGQVVKSVEDRFLGSILLLISLPIFVLIAIAIRLESPGPVIFRQKRLGFRNNEFTIFKFRSMRVSTEEDPEVTQATKDDARVTKVGAFLRRTSLDELPQLLNVVRGEMSLVGPRPHAVAHNEKYAKIIDEYLGRHKVKPGITGWAQVNGLRGETDTLDKMYRRVQHDLYYIDHWSFAFDLRILAKTTLAVTVGQNAY